MANVDTVDITKLILLEQGSTPSSPSAGKQKLFVRSSDHLLCTVDSSGTVTPWGGALTNPMTTQDDVIIGGAAGAPARLAKGSNGTFLGINGSGHLAYGTPSSGITVSENFLTGDVLMNATNSFFDGPSLSLAAGTYILDAIVTLDNATAGWCTAKIWDGSTEYSGSPSEYNSKAGGAVAITVMGYVVLGTTTTVKVSAAQQISGGHIKATDPQGNGTANKASYLRATKIA